VPDLDHAHGVAETSPFRELKCAALCLALLYERCADALRNIRRAGDDAALYRAAAGEGAKPKSA
jgi:hypothetical protein